MPTLPAYHELPARQIDGHLLIEPAECVSGHDGGFPARGEARGKDRVRD